MKRNDKISLVAILLILISIWWFFGRKPYVELESPWDPVLIYSEPKWHGWDRSGMIYKKVIPTDMKHLSDEGWWYVRRQIKPIPKDLIDINEPMEKSFRKLNEYYMWKPL